MKKWTPNKTDREALDIPQGLTPTKDSDVLAAAKTLRSVSNNAIYTSQYQMVVVAGYFQD